MRVSVQALQRKMPDGNLVGHGGSLHGLRGRHLLTTIRTKDLFARFDTAGVLDASAGPK